MKKEEVQNNAMAVLVALGLGIAIGANWPKIKKNFAPLLAGLEKQYGNLSFATLGALAGQKEKFEDMLVARKERTKKPGAAQLIKKVKSKK